MTGRSSGRDRFVAAVRRGDEVGALAALQDIAGLDDWDPANTPADQRTSGGALAAAIGEGMCELVGALLGRGVDPELRWQHDRTPLIVAVMRRQLAVVRVLLARGARVDRRDASGRTPRAIAEQAGATEIAAALRDAGGTSDEPRSSPLHRAIVAGDRREVAACIAGGADVDAPGGVWPNAPLERPRGATPLMLAVERGDLEVCRALLAAGANPGAAAGGVTALQLAISAGTIAVVDVLLAAGAPLQGHSTICPLALTIVRRDAAMLARLIAAGADLRGRRTRLVDRTPLQHAAGAGWLAGVEQLLAAGAEVNLRNCWGASALEAALEPGEAGDRPRREAAAIAARLREAGARDERAARDELIAATRASDEERVLAALRTRADPNASQGGSGWSALRYAVAEGRAAIAAHLLKVAAPNDQCALTAHESRPLIVCAGAGGSPEILDMLLAAGHDVDAADSIGCTALSEAARHGHVAAVQQLVAAGAALSHPHALSAILCQTNKPAVMRALVAGGADVDEMSRSARIHDGRTIDGCTPLLSAILAGDVESVECLLGLGADPTRPARDGTTPLALARSLRRGHAVALLEAAMGATDPVSPGETLRARVARWLRF